MPTATSCALPSMLFFPLSRPCPAWGRARVVVEASAFVTMWSGELNAVVAGATLLQRSETVPGAHVDSDHECPSRHAAACGVSWCSQRFSPLTPFLRPTFVPYRRVRRPRPAQRRERGAGEGGAGHAAGDHVAHLGGAAARARSSAPGTPLTLRGCGWQNIVDKVKTSAAAEHEQFLREKEKYSGPDDAVEQDTSLPWEFSRADLGTEVSDEARERVLKLSTDDRT